MYLACLKNEHNLYELISQSHKEKRDLKDRIIFYEFENNELDNKKLPIHSQIIISTFSISYISSTSILYILTLRIIIPCKYPQLLMN